VLTAALVACKPAAEEPAAEEPAVQEPTEPVVEEPMEKAFKACQVTDVGGIDDKSFNATAWKGVQDAIDAYGVDGTYLESQQQTDYEVNINAFLEEDCDVIISVGYLLADATAAAAEANPDVPFAIVDTNWLDFPNLYGSGFQIDQATFLAGYLAAGMTKTGKVGTYGGINIPPVTQFMDGFVLGVNLYNETHGTDVQVLGWDIAAQDGLFTGNFESTDDGRTMGESLLDEGADIIMPVAGPVGAGTLAVLEERGSGLLIGVDNDWSAPYAYPNQADYILASALKNMDQFVTNAIKAVMDGTFKGGNLMGTLDHGYVGMAYGSAWESKIPDDLKAEIAALIPQITAGTITTMPVAGEAPAEMAIGTEDHPIKVLFVPSVDANIIVTGGQIMADALKEATGLNFEVTVPTSYAATIEEMCASPTDTMAFIPGLGYAIASQLCGVDVAFKAIRYGYPVYWAEYIVARDSEFQTLADLEGATWGYGDQGSTSGYMVPTVELAAAGITPGEQVQTGGHNQTVTAVYNGEVDFGTVFYSVPLTPEGTSAFTWADYQAGKITSLDQYEIPAEAIPNCAPDAEGKKLLCDGWRVLDARANIRTEAPDVMQKVRILAVSASIPNDTLAFGPDFPADVRALIEEALVAFAGTDAWKESIGSNDFYGWTGIEPATDAEYDMVRAMVEATGYKIEP
jgi:phosphate/phosphite/phosphonate ABC transporter binding protein